MQKIIFLVFISGLFLLAGCTKNPNQYSEYILLDDVTLSLEGVYQVSRDLYEGNNDRMVFAFRMKGEPDASSYTVGNIHKLAKIFSGSVPCGSVVIDSELYRKDLTLEKDILIYTLAICEPNQPIRIKVMDTAQELYQDVNEVQKVWEITPLPLEPENEVYTIVMNKINADNKQKEEQDKKDAETKAKQEAELQERKATENKYKEVYELCMTTEKEEMIEFCLDNYPSYDKAVKEAEDYHKYIITNPSCYFSDCPSNENFMKYYSPIITTTSTDGKLIASIKTGADTERIIIEILTNLEKKFRVQCEQYELQSICEYKAEEASKNI